MNTIELNSQKIEFVKQFLDEPNEEVLKKVMAYFKKVKKTTAPCQMTIEELKAEVEEAEREIADGDGMKHETFMKEVESWF